MAPEVYDSVSHRNEPTAPAVNEIGRHGITQCRQTATQPVMSRGTVLHSTHYTHRYRYPPAVRTSANGSINRQSSLSSDHCSLFSYGSLFSRRLRLNKAQLSICHNLTTCPLYSKSKQSFTPPS